MFVLIGCPVYQREWMLPAWFEAIERQDFPLTDIGFVFEVASDDEPTRRVLMAFHERHPELVCFDVFANDTQGHQAHADGRRYWVPQRYASMANFRNALLDQVICHEPDRFFSLDSDVLLENPATLSTLVELTEAHDAVSPLMFMTPLGTGFPNVMTWWTGVGNQACRLAPYNYPYGTMFQADIIMAAVMMSRKVYTRTRYQYHRQGEDLGWSADCATKGLELFSASYLYTPHIMSERMLETYKLDGDARGIEAIKSYAQYQDSVRPV